MPREALIGLTLMLTLAVLGAGNAPTEARAANASPDALSEAMQDATTAVETAEMRANERRLTLESPAGRVQLIGATGDNELSLTVRFDEAI